MPAKCNTLYKNSLSHFHNIPPGERDGETENREITKEREMEPIRLEFQCMQDGAWYGITVRSEEEGRVLRVMFTNFSAASDEKYIVDKFETMEELEEFGKRFRRGSIQLQDWECRKVVKGIQVIVANFFSPIDYRFYDAIIDSVNSKVHPRDEQCSCTFVVLWQHGPLFGERTSTCIEKIRLLQPKNLRMDPTVTKFLDTARKILVERKSQVTQTDGHYQENSRQKIEHDPVKFGGTSNSTGQLKYAVDCRMKKSRDSSGCPEYGVVKANDASCSRGPRGSPIGSQLKKCRYFPKHLKNGQSSKKAGDKRQTPIAGRSSKGSDEDLDLGSELSKETAHPEKTLYFFRVENMEHDLSPFDVMDFILKQASITSYAFICPSILEEFYLRATILVETEEEANKLYEFLHDSSHIITSIGGRPWLTNENWCGYVDGNMPRYKMSSKTERKGRLSKIKLVRKGTKAYEQAKRQQALHAEFHDNVRKNLGELMVDEIKLIRQQVIKQEN